MRYRTNEDLNGPFIQIEATRFRPFLTPETQVPMGVEVEVQPSRNDRHIIVNGNEVWRNNMDMGDICLEHETLFARATRNRLTNPNWGNE